MSEQLKRQQIADGVFFNSISSSKFKHNRLSIHCILPLEEETAAVNAIVPMLLTMGSKKCPDFSELNKELNNLYGASLSTRVLRFNRYQTVGISISSLDNRFALKDEDIVKQSADMLADLFFEPNLNDKDEFDSKTLELEKQSLIDTISSEINDKRTYAVYRCMEEMYKNEGIAVSRYGTVEKAQEITPLSAGKAWENIIYNAPVEIMFVGSGDPSSAMELLSRKFGEIKRSPAPYSFAKIRDVADKVTEITEEIEGLQQGKLVMGMRCANLDTAEQRNAAKMFSAMYGGTPFSKLFLNVREKLSLCYYCASRIDTANNHLLVDSGVENENKQKAEEEILNQLDSLKNGKITDQELESTKLLMTNSLKSVGDTQVSLEFWYFQQILRNENTSPDEEIKNLSKVTIPEIVEIANGVTLDTVYFLTGKEEQ